MSRPLPGVRATVSLDSLGRLWLHQGSEFEPLDPIRLPDTGENLALVLRGLLARLNAAAMQQPHEPLPTLTEAEVQDFMRAKLPASPEELGL